MMPDSCVDHQARSEARSANEKIGAHEKFCEERARKAERFEKTTDESFRRLHQRLDKVVWGILAVILSALGQIAVTVLFNGVPAG